jgi:uncharacterized protein YgiM (DUF1202 family)
MNDALIDFSQTRQALMKNRTRHNLVFLSLILILMGGCIATAPPLPPTMYINPPVTYLREGPSLDSPTLVELQAGDQLDVGETTESGWVKVRSVRTNLYGWVPKDLLAATPPPPKPVVAAPEKPRLPAMYVAVKTVNMKEEPSNKSKTVKELQFNNKVEKLDENESGWYQVRVPEGSVTGWVPKRSLEAYMLPKPRVLYKAKRTGGGKKPAEEAPAPDAM